MGVDQDAQHAKRFVVFDETHAAHVRGEIVDKVDARDRAFAAFFFAKIELQIFGLGEHLKPFLERFHIDRANFFSLAEQVRHQMAADKAAAAANYDFFRFHLASRRPNESGTLPGKRAASTRSKLHALLAATPLGRAQKPVAHKIINKK